MASTVTIDLRQVARGLEIPLRQIQAVVELLDEGNTVPFITRYRKDPTGGLDEEQIRDIQARLVKSRLLAERKQTVLRSIEAQGKLTEKLGKQILSASTTKRLEDLYLPYKPKKQTLATVARSRGLEELAQEILDAAPTATDLDARAKEFVSVDRQVKSGPDALLGAGHILAEWFSERADLRHRLREVLQRSGKISTTQIGGEQAAVTEERTPPAPSPTVAPTSPSAERPVQATEQAADLPPTSDQTAASGAEAAAADLPVDVAAPADPPAEPINSGLADSATEAPAVASETSPLDAASETSEPPGAASAALPPILEHSPSELAGETLAPQPAGETLAPRPASESPAPGAAGENPAPHPAPASPPPIQPSAAIRRTKEREKAKQARLNKKELKKKRILERRTKAFRDYFNFTDELKKIPPHRVLAINRGERARVLRVRIESDLDAMFTALDEMLVPPGHPHADYLRGCARDALTRLILPGLEREARRELTDRAEEHAVGVFARNLRNLLLQPPVHGRRLLAVDPGFKSGCKLAALDQFGNVLGHDVITLVGKPERREEARQKSLELIGKFELKVVAIGNGTGCRDTEDFFAELIGSELKEQGVAYVIVNEAGASVYSTSQIGREEFPEYDASLRGAISIGRRLLDPLSELVKIEPANIGVGLYQHDVKAKHLQTSLDEVVESCVNYVGVDVNTASPALLRYVSGLNQLTARRIYEHRREHGPFRSREKLHEVPGVGDATFVQAAGFLKIANGENPLDATWIHPESYAVATRVLERLGCKPSDLCDREASAALAQRVAGVDLNGMAKELEVGVLTLKDILAQLARPGRDPRDDLPPPVFKQGVLKLEDLTPGMELTGTVLNVVDFGCFVDIGMHDSGLVHVSRMADRFIRDPYEAAAVGDIVKVWVMEVDKERRRVSLTMVRPGTERQRYGHRDERRPEGAQAAEQGEGQRSQQRPPFRPGGPGRGDQGGRGEGRGGRTEGRGARGEGRRDQGRRDQGHGAAASGDRPPQGGGRPPMGGGSRPPRPQGGPPRGKPRFQDRPPRPAYQPKPPPKPLTPITDAMKKGKEPMRTFGDLMQFFQVTQEPAQPQGPAKPKPRMEPPADPAPPKPPAPPQDSQVEFQQPPPDASEAPTAASEPPPAVSEPQLPAEVAQDPQSSAAVAEHPAVSEQPPQASERPPEVV